ncbi:cuticle protein 8-like [Vanessa cardui]|uniref:cuticle protein 8-like n=1 Tax=Vanessa cardui TaxID=171605 RepID=UPI001F12E7FC|nr:cuticle protein 8-like [Vanessa cardui]
MNHILMVTFLIVLSATVWGKVISDVVDAIDNPRYAFNYAISDPLTNDNKAQWEERDGDHVNGAYSLLEPDGNLRVVEYSADDISGFSAIVKNLADRLGSTSLHKPLPYPIPPINPLIDPHSYGFGASPLAVDVPKVKVTGSSLPWDRETGSYGGWVPINGPTRKIPFATIYNKKYVNGQLHKIVYGPIPLPSKSIILIKKKHIDD